jgi:hypothetical protein
MTPIPKNDTNMLCIIMSSNQPIGLQPRPMIELRVEAYSRIRSEKVYESVPHVAFVLEVDGKVKKIVAVSTHEIIQGKGCAIILHKKQVHFKNVLVVRIDLRK